MRIISFSWTTPALLAHRKTVTRRNWADSHAAGFKEGELVQAWDKSPRAGGKRVGTIRLTCKPYRERTDQVPDQDWEGEGFAYLEEIGVTLKGVTPADVWSRWKCTQVSLYVVRFEVVAPITPDVDALSATRQLGLWPGQGGEGQGRDHPQGARARPGNIRARPEPLEAG